jgi:hypothetical protein
VSIGSASGALAWTSGARTWCRAPVEGPYKPEHYRY